MVAQEWKCAYCHSTIHSEMVGIDILCCVYFTEAALYVQLGSKLQDIVVSWGDRENLNAIIYALLKGCRHLHFYCFLGKGPCWKNLSL